MVSVSGYLIGSPEANKKPLPPNAERFNGGTQYYFSTERGRIGYEKYRDDFAKLIWQLASPKWRFDDATFDRTAVAFNNPDHVSIVIHNYRWRLGLADGERQYDDLERRLAEGPVITVPTVTLEGDANVARHIPSQAPTQKSSRGSTCITTSREASGTTCLRKRRAPSPRRSSKPTVFEDLKLLIAHVESPISFRTS